MRRGEAVGCSGPATLQGGFTFIVVLMAMLLLALATQGIALVLSQQAQREREAQLLKIGAEFVRAIGDYYESTPGSVKRWPRTLDELVEDKRFVTVRRHLRRVYLDPMTRDMTWGVVSAADGGISGVYSLNTDPPIRTDAMQLADLRLPPAARYSDWRFVYIPGTRVPSTTTVITTPTTPKAR